MDGRFSSLCSLKPCFLLTVTLGQFSELSALVTLFAKWDAYSYDFTGLLQGIPKIMYVKHLALYMSYFYVTLTKQQMSTDPRRKD